jgi:hypothetical protein
MWFCYNILLVFVINLGHSDPAKLKESAEDVQRLSASELQKRQLEIKVRIFSNQGFD